MGTAAIGVVGVGVPVLGVQAARRRKSRSKGQWKRYELLKEGMIGLPISP
jgi:hypothetical protein